MMFAHIRVCAPCIHLAQVFVPPSHAHILLTIFSLHTFVFVPPAGIWIARTIMMTSRTTRSWMLHPSFSHLTVPVESRIAMATSSASHLVPGDLLLLRPFARLWSTRPRSYVEFHGDLFRHVVINGLPCSDKR